MIFSVNKNVKIASYHLKQKYYASTTVASVGSHYSFQWKHLIYWIHQLFEIFAIHVFE